MGRGVGVEMNLRTKTENTENKDILNASTAILGREREDGQRREAATKTKEEPTELLPENYTQKND